MSWKLLDAILGRKDETSTTKADTDNLRFDRKRLDKALDRTVQLSGEAVRVATEFDIAVKKLVEDFRSKEKQNAKVPPRSRKT